MLGWRRAFERKSIAVAINHRLIIVRIFIAFGVLVLSGCATVDQAEEEDNPSGVNLSYDGNWIASVTKYRREQVLFNSRIRWTCGDGKPFQFQLNVKDGSVSVFSMNGKPVKIGKVSSSSKFKTIYSMDAEFTSVYTGSFKKKVGKIQSRKNQVNGCVYKFLLEKNSSTTTR